MVHENLLTYEDLKEGDLEEIVSFLAKNFALREPVSAMLDVTYEDYKACLPNALRLWLEDGVSIVARDSSNEKIAGCLMAAVLTPKRSSFFENGFTPVNKKIETLNKVVEMCEKSVNLFEKHNIDILLDIAMVTVGHEYAGRGIGKSLVFECEKRGRACGCKMATAQATNVSSQNLFIKLGYSTYAELPFDSMRIEGKQVFELNKTLNGTPSVKIVARHLLN